MPDGGGSGLLVAGPGDSAESPVRHGDADSDGDVTSLFAARAGLPGPGDDGDKRLPLPVTVAAEWPPPRRRDSGSLALRLVTCRTASVLVH